MNEDLWQLYVCLVVVVVCWVGARHDSFMTRDEMRWEEGQREKRGRTITHRSVTEVLYANQSSPILFYFASLSLLYNMT